MIRNKLKEEKKEKSGLFLRGEFLEKQQKMSVMWGAELQQGNLHYVKDA